jgi:hypothetical protein
LSDSAPLSVSLDQQQLRFDAHPADDLWQGNFFQFSNASSVSAAEQQQLLQLFGVAFVFSTDGQQILFCSAHFTSAKRQLFSSGAPCFAIDCQHLSSVAPLFPTDDRPRPGTVQLHGPVPLQGKQQRLGHCYNVLLSLLE